MIRVESESGVVNVEAADLLGNCEIEVSYFTANYFITTVPEGKFKSIFKLTAKNNAASKTIKIVYSILWLMLKATGCREANVRKIEISRMNCPQVQVGLTIYPTTTTSEIDILVLGSCVAYSNQRSVKPQLVCSNNGKWRFANDHRPADACFCREGLIFQDNSCVKTGPVCYECKPGSISSCQNTVARHCNINEVCMTVMHRFNGQVVVEKKCSAECFQKMKNQNACQQGLESCTMCCNRDYCNISPFISRPATEKVSLSSALPECIDRQPMQLKCLQNLNVKRHHYAFSEPIFIPWPEVVDNDPNFRIIPNLKITSEPFVFTGNEPQIHWTALDKHNQISECVTNVIYEGMYTIHKLLL
uniref:TNFR-Cys domain-containing protein n=1 Tax=Panagrolaimus sp. JU765 TaxID=591449 RepID=A0AC34PUQ7_9BILA